MFTPESGGDDSDAPTSFPIKSPDSQNNESTSTSSPPKNHSDYSKKDPPATIEQTPTRFLASCSKLDLEPNPFEQSFSGVATSEVGTNSPKPSLPPVSQIASPGIPANNDQYGWSLQSLRSGTLSPSILDAPQDATIYNNLPQTCRTGTTPLPYAPYPESSTGIFGSTTNSFVNPSLPVISSDPFARSSYNQVAPRSLPDSDRKSISSNPSTSAPVSNASTSQSTVIQPALSTTNLLNLSNGSSTSSTNVIPLNHQTVLVTNPALNNRNIMCTPQHDMISRNTMISADPIMTKTENDVFASHSNNIITNLPNGNHSNTINSRKSSIMSDSMDEDSLSPSSSSKMVSSKSGSRNSRRKADEPLVKDQPPSKKNGQKVKNEMTDEEKRRNFLERNRQAALKCRQRKKQWLANLQAKVEYLTNDNENLQSQAQSLREEIINLKTLLLAHKDCPIAQANGVMGLDSIPPTSQGMPPNMNGMNMGPMGMGIPNPGMPTGVSVNGVQGTMPMSNVQVPPHMTNHVTGPPGSGMMRY